MAYEVEQFVIKIVLIEQGVIKDNFDRNLKLGKDLSTTPTDGRDSPHTDMTEKRIAGFKPRFENG